MFADYCDHLIAAGCFLQAGGLARELVVSCLILWRYVREQTFLVMPPVYSSCHLLSSFFRCRLRVPGRLQAAADHQVESTQVSRLH